MATLKEKIIPQVRGERSGRPRTTKRRALVGTSLGEEEKARKKRAPVAGRGASRYEADAEDGAAGPCARMRRSSTASTGASSTTSTIGAAAVHMATFRPI